MAAWQAEYDDDLEGLRWRYEKVKEIARRSWRPGRRLPEPLEPLKPRSEALIPKLAQRHLLSCPGVLHKSLVQWVASVGPATANGLMHGQRRI
jgi:hypothetical protein